MKKPQVFRVMTHTELQKPMMPYSGPPRDMPRAVAPAVAPSISVVMVPMMDRRSQAKGPPTMLMKAIITLNTWGFFIVDLLFFHKIEKIKGVVDRYDTKMFDAIGMCVMTGCITKFMTGQMVGGLPKIVAGVSGFIIMLALVKVSEKAPKLKEFALGLSMLAAIFIAQAVRVMGG